MTEPTEQGMTVTPNRGLQVLERAKGAIYAAFEDQGDSPASAVSTAIVGYGNALARIAALEAVVDVARKVADADTAALQELKKLGLLSAADTTLIDELGEALANLNDDEPSFIDGRVV